MNAPRIASGCIVAALLAISVAIGLNNAVAQRDPPGSEEGVEVLTRGPVHEAFAETISFDPEPGVVVAKLPPEAIEELPPEQKPEGAHVDWIPGYWAWDDERADFLWVSGIWRALPPGRQWVPGYWGGSGRGAQWISGYWGDAEVNEVEYLPEPPATLEEGPNIAAPDADHIWAPGCWVWNQTRFAWRPGYWAAAQPNWLWIPAHYVWSPRGYVFIDGYYDYSVARRGVLFAPVYFRSIVYAQGGYSYSPQAVINPAVFTNHLFCRPMYGHYYFGDYYASNYSSQGYSPWFSFHSSRIGYDPFYAHERWHHRADNQWERGVEAGFGRRRDHEEARPPRTWTAQRERSTSDTTGSDKNFEMAISLDELAKSKQVALRFQPVAKVEREQMGRRSQEVRQFREERQKLEAEAAGPSVGAPLGTAKPVKVKLPRTPYVARAEAQVGEDDAPPKRSDAPQLDLKIEPKPRKPRSAADLPTEPKPRGREPRSERPQPEPRSERPQAVPKPPKAETKPQPPKLELKPESPQVEPEPKPPKVEPGPETPKPKGKGKGKNNPRSNRSDQAT